MHTNDYRPDIDGLRAIAVLSVVLYHAGLSWLPGGYVGVDIFFVISGYLIIGQIAKGLADGSFAFADFWARRALRILPPYLLVILTSMVIAPFILVLPEEYQQFTQEVIWSALMIVNHLFLAQQGYFDTGADSKILLHLWSLAVEEQFYILAPLAMFAFWRLSKGASRPIVVGFVALVVFAVSFAACILLTGGNDDANYAFFLMPLRIWEFVAGGAVALLVPAARKLPSAVIDVVGVASLALIVYCVTQFTHRTPFPSYWALLPILGSVGLILSGTVRAKAPSARLLALPPMVWIGLVSYAWYLWHWPLLAFARIYNFGDKSLMFDLAMVALSLLLAILTRFAVEKPILRWRRGRKLSLGWRPTFAGVAAAGATSLLAMGLFEGVGKDIDAFAAGANQQPFIFCDLRQDMRSECLDVRPRGIMIGDSHARASLRALTRVAASHNSQLIGATSAGCVSLVTAKVFASNKTIAKDCAVRQEDFRAAIADGTISPKYAILYSRWILYAGGKNYKVGPAGSVKPPKDQKKAFVDEFERTVGFLKEAGVERILVVGSPPTFPRQARRCIARADHYGISRDLRCSVKVAKASKPRKRTLEWLSAAIGNDPSIRMIDPTTMYCDEKWCRPYIGDKVLFSDTNHPTDAGIEAIVSRFQTDFDWVFEPARKNTVSVTGEFNADKGTSRIAR
jgi:peptidoglycan/LPS O-acetylase OafA/YrhL